ncbi:MAG: penicillin-binding protein activator [Thermodesulfobacteriota bacterium]
MKNDGTTKRLRAAGGRKWIPAGLLTIMLCMLLAACGGMKPQAPQPAAEAAAAAPLPASPDELFSQGEDLSRRGDKAGAQAAFTRMARAYPASPRAAEALFMAGNLASEQEGFAEAADLFTRLADDYQSSAYGPDSCVLAVVNWGKAGRPERVSSLVKKYYELPLPQGHKIRLLLAGSDAAAALRDYESSARLAMAASDLASGPEKKEAFGKLVSAGFHLSPRQALALVPPKATCGPGANFLLAVAEKHLDAKNTDQARELLSTVMAGCPGAPSEARAIRLWNVLSRITNFDRHLLGCLIPLSGPYAKYGESVKKGAELAVSLYNAKSTEIAQLLFKDSGGTDKTAAEGFAALVEANVAAVIGPIAASEAVAGLANQEAVPVVVFSQKEGLTVPGGYLFRNYLTPELQARALVSYTVREKGLLRYAILYPKESYGETFLSAFWDQVVAQGGTVTAVESYDPSLTDFGDPIKRLTGASLSEGKDKAPPPQDAEAADEAEREEEVTRTHDAGPGVVDFDVVFIPDSPRKAGLILPQLLYYDVRGVLPLGTNLWHSSKLYKVAGKYADGSIFPDIFYPKSEDRYVSAFVTAFREQFGTEPAFLEALGFDTAMTLLTAGDRFQVKNSRSLRQALVDGGPFAGVTGLTYFTDSGEAVKDLYLLKAENQTFFPVHEPQTQP